MRRGQAPQPVGSFRNRAGEERERDRMMRCWERSWQEQRCRGVRVTGGILGTVKHQSGKAGDRRAKVAGLRFCIVGAVRKVVN